MTLINSGHAPRMLIGAASPDFGEVSFHQMHMKNSVNEMAAVSTVTVAPRSGLQFSPGGYHLILMRPRRALQPGDHVPITLRFADGESLNVQFEVRTASGSAPGRSDDMGRMPGMQH